MSTKKSGVLADLLQTKDPTQQVARVRQALKPVVTVVIQHDGRTNQWLVAPVGCELDANQLLAILSTCTQQLLAQASSQLYIPPQGNGGTPNAPDGD